MERQTKIVLGILVGLALLLVVAFVLFAQTDPVFQHPDFVDLPANPSVWPE
jgi:hypothetical protein